VRLIGTELKTTEYTKARTFQRIDRDAMEGFSGHRKQAYLNVRGHGHSKVPNAKAADLLLALVDQG